MFLKLHDANDKPLRINMSLIESYGVITEQNYNSDSKDGTVDCNGLTYLVPTGITKTEPCYVVKETPSQIDGMLSAAASRGDTAI